MLKTYTKDTFSVVIETTDSDTNLPFSLVGAEVTASAVGISPKVDLVVVGAVSIPNPTLGEIEITFSPYSFSKGQWNLQVSILKNAKIQTVSDLTFLVVQSH